MDQAVAVDPRSLLCCPACGGALAPAADWTCSACALQVPVIDGVPWLTPHAGDVLAAWRHDLRALLSALRSQAAQYRAALAPGAAAPVRERLGRLASACDDHAARLGVLMAPLGLGAAGAAPEAYRAVAAPLPPGQSLTGYYANLHRDWCWGDDENAAARDAVERALGDANPGRLLVPGCGAGRLAYDLHVRRRPAVTVAADLNPLMLGIARRMYAGESVELHEFPLAPRDLASQAVLRRLAAPMPAPPGLWPVLADLAAAPFAAGAWDTVVTHWLVDVLDEDFATFAARVNGWLRPGGRWVNSGSFFFQHGDPAACPSVDELPALLRAAGFGQVEIEEREVPYLASPASRQRRIERVVTFSAVAQRRVAPPPPRRHLPAWLDDPTRPMPVVHGLESHVLALRVHAWVASLVDGRRTLEEVAGVLVRERLMPADEALPAVREFMRRLYAECERGVRP
jgi:SAM-dependent methyltransferase